jgi:FixJ family two-component response regulator
VLDVRIPGLSGMDLQHELNESGIHIPIIFVTGHGAIPISVRAMKAGGGIPHQGLLDAIRAAIERARSASRERSQIGEVREHYDLTSRAREVMALVAAGMLNKQIASELATTERTVKIHRAHTMQKMNAKSLADLVRMVEKLGVSSRNQ